MHGHPLNHAGLIFAALILTIYPTSPSWVIKPGNTPIYPMGTDDVAQLTIQGIWKTNAADFQTENNCNTALQQHLTDYIDPVYIPGINMKL